MLKSLVLVLAVIAVWGGASIQRGCKDAQRSLTQLAYPPKRDMRTTVGIAPQKIYLSAPDSLSVPTRGRERWNEADAVAERDRLDRTFVNPQASDDSSLARGERKFLRTCVPCHGRSMKGDGPVVAKFIPPPDLMAAMTRGRSDGFIFAYIRHGGAVMPSYGAQVTAQEAYDVINYLRHMQRTNPR